jgi:hypothetical protein
MSEKTSIYNLTAPVVMTFPNLHEAKAFGPKGKESGEPKFSANFLFAPDNKDFKAMKALAVQIAHQMWPGRDVKELCFPFSSGDKLADDAKAKNKNAEFNRGKYVMAARSKYEPRLSGIENGVAVDYEGDARKAAKSKFFPGVEVLAQFNFVAYKGVGRNPDGVTAYLNMVFTTGKGERLGGGAPAAEVFSAYIGKPSNLDPVGVMDDEIPF